MSAHQLRGRAARLPIRVRLVAGFVLAMTVVLGGAGGFVYWRVQTALDAQLDTELSAGMTALRALVGPDAAVAGGPGASYQVLTVDGRVVAAGSDLGQDPLLGPADLAQALRGPVHLDLGALLPGSARPLRLLAERGGPGVLVVGVRRDQRDEALRELLGQLLLAGVVALAVSSVVGERLARAALAPVERYRTQSAAIAAGASGVRLDVPAGRDDEVTRLGHTLNEVLAALEDALDAERRFVADASHELRTPLTVLSTRVQLLRRRPRTVAEHEGALDELQTDVAALTALADQLLSTAAATHPAQDGLHAVDLRAVAVAATAGSDDVLVDAPGGTVDVPVGPVALQQVVSNLVTNARIHGGRPIHLRAGLHHDLLVITVHDSGPGMDRELLVRAAERFHRGGGTQGTPGTGLGLALVEALVSGSRGELRLCSGGQHHRVTGTLDVVCEHPDIGTTATVGWPLQTWDAGPTSRTGPAGPRQTGPQRRHSGSPPG